MRILPQSADIKHLKQQIEPEFFNIRRWQFLVSSRSYGCTSLLLIVTNIERSTQKFSNICTLHIINENRRANIDDVILSPVKNFNWQKHVLAKKSRKRSRKYLFDMVKYNNLASSRVKVFILVKFPIRCYKNLKLNTNMSRKGI